jgi:anti-sigma factor RsiW
MNRTAQPPDPATHKVVDALLPWFVNGTLNPVEHDLVRRHLEECVECREQVQWLRDLHAACIAGSKRPGSSQAFEQLRRGLESRAVPRRTTRAGRMRSAAPWMVAAAMTLVAVGGIWRIASDDPLVYRTLGAAQSAHGGGGDIVVVFDAAAREADVRRILRAAEARIVDGPTATNGYVLDIAEGQQQKALVTLRGERAVLLAEPLSIGAAR